MRYEELAMSAAALTRMLRYRRATADESKKESITFVILSFAWCHQESQFISKWLNIITF